VTVLTVLAEPVTLAPPRHSPVLVLGTGLLALVLALFTWPIMKHTITLAHEGGHALFVKLSGGTVESVKVNRGTSSGTSFAGLGGLGRFVSALAGYLGPSLFGLAGAVLLTRGRTVAVLWLSLAFLALMMLVVANLFGAVVLVGTGGLLVLAARYATGEAQTVAAYTWVWFLLIGGFLHVLDFRRERAKGPDTGSDAVQLRRMTYLPAPLWVGFFWLATLAALLYGAAVLLGRAALGG
jgi:hypothetical protein